MGRSRRGQWRHVHPGKQNAPAATGRPCSAVAPCRARVSRTLRNTDRRGTSSARSQAHGLPLIMTGGPQRGCRGGWRRTRGARGGEARVGDRHGDRRMARSRALSRTAPRPWQPAVLTLGRCGTGCRAPRRAGRRSSTEFAAGPQGAVQCIACGLCILLFPILSSKSAADEGSVVHARPLHRARLTFSPSLIIEHGDRYLSSFCTMLYIPSR